MSTSPIVITPSTSVVLVNTADYSGNPVVLLPNLAGPGALGRVITVRDNDGGSYIPSKSIYLSTTGGALFQQELSTVQISSFSIQQPYGFITITPRYNDSSGNTQYGLMNLYAFNEATTAAYVNTLNANFSYLSTLSTINLTVNQDTFLQGNLTVNGNITYVQPNNTTFNIGTINTNLISTNMILNSNFYGVNIAASTINTSTFVVRDSGSVLMPNAGSWSNFFGGGVDENSLTFGNPSLGAGTQIASAGNFFGIRSFTKAGSTTYSTNVVFRDRNVAINPTSLNNIGASANIYSNYRLYVNGSSRLSNQELNNNILLLKQTTANNVNYEVNEFGGTLGTFHIDSSSNITEGFFDGGDFNTQFKWLTVDKNGSIKFWTSPAGDTSVRFTIDNTGNVGIGKTPVAPFDVSGDAAFLGVGSFTQFSSDSISLNHGFVIQNSTGSNYMKFFTKLQDGAYNDMTTTNDKGLIFSEGSINTGNLVIAPWSATPSGIRIKNNGKVGINSKYTEPINWALTVDASLNDGIMSRNRYGDARIFIQPLNGGNYTELKRNDGANGDFVLTNNGSGRIIFNPGGVTYDQSIVLSNTGYVGIGTLTPDTTLHVNTTDANTTSGVLSRRYYLGAVGDNQDTTGSSDNNGGPWYGLGYSAFGGTAGEPASYPCLAGYGGVLMRSGNGYVYINNSTGGTTIKGAQGIVKITADANPNVANIEVGGGRSVDGLSYIDFVSQVGADYNTRFGRGSGVNGDTSIEHTGTGSFFLKCTNSAAISLQTNNTECVQINAAGDLVMNSGTNRSLIFGNTLLTNKISLYGSGTSGFFGFGIQANTLVYNVNGTSDNHIFYQGGTGGELMRIQGNGSVGIGTATPGSYKLNVNGASIINGDTTLSGNVGINGATPNSTYNLDVTGKIRATDDILAFSDIRVKKNICTIDNALEKIKELRGVSYTGISSSVKKIGVIAQEIEKILPEVVSTDDTEEHYKSVSYGNIVAVLIEGIKELAAKVDALERH